MRTKLTAAVAALVAALAVASPASATTLHYYANGEIDHAVAYANWDGQYWLPVGVSFGNANPELDQDIQNCENWYDTYTPDIVFNTRVDFNSAKIRAYDSYDPNSTYVGLEATQYNGSWALNNYNDYYVANAGWSAPDNQQPTWANSHHWSLTGVACHEMGHAMGLGHDYSQGGNMEPFGYESDASPALQGQWTQNWSAIPLQDEGNWINWVYHYHNADDGV